MWKAAAMNLRSYVTMHLSVDGYDGLCWQGTCGCGYDGEGTWDLMPCGEPNVECRPAWRCVCAEHPECEHHGNCDTEGEGQSTCYRPGRRP